MAENKKSFVLYADLINNIDHLTNEEKGILFNHLLEYVNDMNPVLTDRVVLSAWKFIQSQLKRDLVKFEEVKGKRSEAGKESARLRALKKEQQSSTKLTSVKSVQQTSTNPTVNVNENVNVNDINNKVVVDISFEPYKLKYKTYASKIMQDAGQLETLSRKYKMTADPSVYKPTCQKYLKHFLEHLNIGEDKHERAGLFNKHFDSWLGKQPTIKNVVKEKQIVRYS
jgi:uncharacterized protein YdaU (DUF1376 family)